MTIQITHKDLEDTAERIFFIVGTSRSGSTLLQSMLSSHSEIVIPPESHFFHSSEELTQKHAYSKDKSEFRNRLIHFWYQNKTRISDLGLKMDEVAVQAASLDLHAPLDLFTLQLSMYRKKRGKSIIGEKTPRHILQVKQILKAYPKARIISMFRDPRAAAWSEIKAHFGSPSVYVTTRRWRNYIDMHYKLADALPSDQYMMLRYTDLIENPKGMLNKISDFLGVEFEEQMLQYYKRDEIGFAEGEKSWKKGTLKPIQENKNEEWKSSLTKWQVTLVEQAAGKRLQEMGYQKSEHSLSFPKKLFYQCLDFSRSIWATLTNARQEGYKDPGTLKF